MNYPQHGRPAQHGYPQHSQPQHGYPQHGYPQHSYPQHSYPRDEYPQQHAQSQHGHSQPNYAAPAPEKRRRRWPWVVLAVVALFVVIGVVNGPNRPTAPTTPAASGGNISAATADASEAAPPAPSGPLTTFGDGTWEVGVDIESGKYKTTGPVGPICYYARLKTGDGSIGDILGNNNSNGPATVTIKESDGYFESMGCADWVKAD